MAMKRVRGQHHMWLTYKPDRFNSDMKADVKKLLRYIEDISAKQANPWSSSIGVYFSNKKRNKNHDWVVEAHQHIHLIIDSDPSSVLINAIKEWWGKRFGHVRFKDVKPTIEDMLALVKYCTTQAKASKYCVWNRTFGKPLEPLQSSRNYDLKNNFPSIDANTNRSGYLLGSIDQHILLPYLVYSLNLNSPIAIQPSILLNYFYADRGSSNSPTPNFSLGDGMIDNLTPPPTNQRNDVCMEELYILLSNLTLDDS